IDRVVLGEQVSAFAPIDHFGRATPAGQAAAARERDRGHLPGERLGCRRDAYVDDLVAADSPTDQLSLDQALAGAELELPQVDRPASQRAAVGLYLAHAAGADEHPPAPHRYHVPVDPGRAAAQVEHHVDDVAHVSTVRPDQRQAGDAAYVHDAV